jgi:hypothetical protein
VIIRRVKLEQLPADREAYEACAVFRTRDGGLAFDVRSECYRALFGQRGSAIAGRPDPTPICAACTHVIKIIGDGRIECALRQLQKPDGCACVFPRRGDRCPISKW